MTTNHDTTATKIEKLAKGLYSVTRGFAVLGTLEKWHDAPCGRPWVLTLGDVRTFHFTFNDARRAAKEAK